MHTATSSRDTDIFAGAYDFNLGCSGYIYGLGQSEGLISSPGKHKGLAFDRPSVYSKFIHPGDKSVRTIFGDAASATLLTATESAFADHQGRSLYGTDGSGANNLIVRTGGMRQPRTNSSGTAAQAESGNVRSMDNLFMDGGAISPFTLSSVPEVVNRLLAKAEISIDQIDLFVFHQANRYMLDHLRKRMKIPARSSLLK